MTESTFDRRSTVNGEPHEIAPGTTLAVLLSQLGVPSDGVAVAVNERVVPRARFAEHVLGAGDAVEIIRAVAGG